MPEIIKGPPRAQGELIRGLVNAAHKDPGEWYSAEVPPDIQGKNIHTLAYTAISQLVAEISITDGRIWIRYFE